MAAGTSIRYGELNGHLIGIVSKEAMRRVIQVIQATGSVFEVTEKGRDDFVTSADRKGQEIYARLLREAFPLFGIVGEENNLKVECEHPHHNIWFTIDPLDGTKAFIRRQSHGIGTMLALVCDGKIIAAYVGDVNTGEIYGYRPGSDKVHRIGTFGKPEQLLVDDKRSLKDQYVLLRDEPDEYTGTARRIFEKRGGIRLFKGMEVTGGSIGVSMARLWKGEVGATILPSGKQTPWDIAPIFGISQMLGFVFLKVQSDGSLSEWKWEPTHEAVRADEELLVIHESRVEEVLEWLKQ